MKTHYFLTAMTADEESIAGGDTSPYTPNLHAAAAAAVEPANDFFHLFRKVIIYTFILV